ncbi:tetratricopeptide repeat protein 27-like [Dendronephthya gigantea]|uniref:tetratricopeptide repeat protein 27-like n=1 Tax=Dendronephthya gigantea TaxID=151771 RepID=UPI00106CD28F|nr:tetratricopeptide repeat protein 27-like [Dendronephthya gigantea]
MSSTREEEKYLDFLNKFECSLFNGDGVVNIAALEQMASCISQPNAIFDEIRRIVECLPNGDYRMIFNGTFAKCLLGSNSGLKSDDISSHFKEQISKELSSTKSLLECYIRQLLILLLGIACLQLVVQQNWLGPPLRDEELTKLGNGETTKNQPKQVFESLSRDGEEVYGLAKNMEYLLAARTILADSRDLLVNIKTQPLWEIRCIYVHQQLLEEPSPSLKAEVTPALERIHFDDQSFSSKLLFRVYLESSYHFLQYFECNKAKEQIEKAQNCVGLELYLEGALGKRTKFQQIDYTQLLAKAKINNCSENGDFEKLDLEHLPKDVTLNDDTLLNKPKLTDGDNNLQEELSSLHLAAIVATCFYKQKSQAHHELLDEEILANVTLLLSQPRVWIVQSIALFLRSKYEKKSSRKKERSMMQLQQLVDQYSDSKAKLSQRMELFYSAPLPPRWKLQRELANLYLEIGVTKSALDVFERLQLWGDVINCYISLGRFEKAESVVRTQLNIKETPILWCLLGDVTKNDEYYRKAWDISGHRSARAQRSLGYLNLRNKKFEESIPCFQKSLEINSLQENVWFSLGCSAMLTGKLEIAAKAFHWCVSLNPDNSEAWNNLSSVYIKMKQKDRAFRTLQEALRANYDNWQMWENFLVIGTDVGAFEQVIQAFHRLMDLKEKYFDIEVLGILVQSVINGIEDNKSLSASRLKPKVKELLGRITSQVTGNGDVWKLYSDLYKDGESEEEKDKFLQFLVKANGVNIQNPGWEKSEEKIEKVVQITLELSKAYHDIAQHQEQTTRAIQLLSSSKLNLRGVISRLKKNESFEISEGREKVLSTALSKLEEELEKTMNAIDDLKSASNR